MRSLIVAVRGFGCTGCFCVCVAVSLLTLPFCVPAFAQQAAPDQPIQLPAISVTVPPPSKPTNQATSNSVVVSPTTLPTPADQSASSVTVITGADLASQQLRTVPDALATVPGLNLVQNGGPGGQTSVFIRGTNSNHVKVLIDGIDVSDPSNPNQSFDFGQLSTGDIERIEILRGPQSGLYGSDAIGGVISITTKNGNGPPKVTATVEGGSFGTFNQRASLSGSQAEFNYAFNIQHFQSTATPVTPLNLLAPGEQRINDTYNNWTYSTKLGANLSDNIAVNLVGRYTDSRLGFTGEDYVDFFPPAPEAAQSTQIDHQFFGRGEVVWSLFDGRFKNFFGLNYTNQWSFNFDPNPDSGYTSPLVLPPTVNLGQRTKFDWRGVAQLTSGQTLVLGLEDQTETLRTNSSGTVDAFFNYTPMTTNAQTGSRAGWIELQSQFAKRFFLVSDFRYDDYDTFGDHETWRVAPVFIVPGSETKLKATYGTGFKAPTLSQLYVNYLGAFPFYGNPNLKPEESRGWDAGFEQPIGGDRFRFGATYFRNDITNLIDTNATFTSWANIDQATMWGIESFSAIAVTSRLSLRGDYTYTVARDDITGEELLRRPKNKASLTATWKATDHLSFSSTLLYVGSWSDVSRDGTMTGIKAPAYSVVNLAVNYAASDKVTLFARIDNLFNEQYQDPLGFDRPGFGIFGGITLTAGGLSSSGVAPGATSPGAVSSPASPRTAGVM